MKKTYIEPTTSVVSISCAKMIAVSGTMSSTDGLNVSIINDGAKSEAESRRSHSIWDDDED